MSALIRQFETSESLATLVRKAKSGDSEALGRLFEIFQPMVLSILLRRVKDFGDAQELSQDVFLKAMQKLDQLRQPEAFAGWLKSIAIRMSINFLQRRRSPAAGAASSIEQLEATERSPLDDTLQRERNSQVHAGMRRLGDLDRKTLEAFYVRGQSLIEMSDAFQAPVGTIKRRLHVARRRLADQVPDLASASN